MKKMMQDKDADCLVAVFDDAVAARRATQAVEALGFSHSDISLITPATEEELRAHEAEKQGDVMEKSVLAGSGIGATIGLLAGSAVLLTPLGPLAIAGALASGLTGGVVGGLIGAMSGWGVEEDHLSQYQESLKEGQSLLIVTAPAAKLAPAEEMLVENSDAVRVRLYAKSADSEVDA